MPTSPGRALCLALVLILVVGTGAGAQNPRSRALWAWDATPLLTDASARQRFLEFCHARSIDIAWVQVTRSPAGNRLQHESGWRDLLRDAHRHGIAIHALDGDPANVRRERHDEVLALVDTIIRFNHDAPRDQRFDGIHFDNEPYLLAGWALPGIREGLLAEYLELNHRVQRAVTVAGGLEYGVDIPFWWQEPDSQTGEAIGNVTFNGVRKPASFHVLDLVDNVGIMDYRNVAGGDDGLIAHARALVEYGNVARAKVFIGVETSPLAQVELPKLTFDGRTNAEMEHELALAEAAFARQPSYAGLAIHHYSAYRDRYP